MIDMDHLSLLKQAIDQAYSAVLITTAELDPPGPEIVYVNRAFCEMTGYRPDEVLGKTPRILQGPRTSPALLRQLRQQLQNQQDFEGATVNYRKDGTPYLVEWNIAAVRDARGGVEFYVATQRDITHRSQVEHYSRTLLNGLGEGVFGLDAEGRFTFVNPAALHLLGYDSDTELLGQTSHLLVHHTRPDGRPYPEDECPIYRVTNTGEPLEAWQDWFWRRDGSALPVEVYASPLEQDLGTVFGTVVVFRDISEQQRLEAQLEHAASHDRLTGLYNRYYFDDLLERECALARRTGTPFCLMMLDIDDFKGINDEYGHLVGDDVLRTFARLVGQRVRSSDVLARWGGEEFVALLHTGDLDGAERLAEEVRRLVDAHSFPGPGHVTLSAGVALLDASDSSRSLLHRTDQALYRAKEAGRNRVAVG